jgi:hypothetical protein
MTPGVEHTLRVGEAAKIKRGFMTSYSIVYAGMLSDYVYSVAVNWTRGNNSAAYNLYVEKGQREIELLGGRLTVLDVTSREIRFRWEKGASALSQK